MASMGLVKKNRRDPSSYDQKQLRKRGLMSASEEKIVQNKMEKGSQRVGGGLVAPAYWEELSHW